MMWRSKHAKVLAAMFGILLVVGLGFFWYRGTAEQSVDIPPPTLEPYRATLTGTYLCLPHTDTSGPHTLECALGLQTDEGEYYALDFNASSGLPPSLPTGSRVTASGTVTPIENLSTTHWQKYPVKGIFSVTDFFQAI